MSLLDAVRDRLVARCRRESRTLVVAPSDGELGQNLRAPSADKKWSKSAAAVADVCRREWNINWILKRTSQ